MRRFFYCILILSVVISCKTEKKIEYKPVPVTINRFDNTLNEIDIYQIGESVEYLLNKYPVFFPLFVYNIIEIGYPDDPGLGDRLAAYQTNKTIYQLNKKVQAAFTDMSAVEGELADAFGRYMYYFPDGIIPEIYTHISGFNQSVVTSENLVSVSLDKYLGSGEEFYNMLYPPIPEYLKYRMHSGRITPDIIYAFGNLEFPMEAENENLFSYMIHEGKLKYFQKHLMPDIHDTVLWGFTPEQISFCTNSEESMWVYLIEQKLLFETNEMTISKFVKEAPFTKDFTKDSPGQAVNRIGYHIVESYMDKHKEISLKQLMQNNNYQGILNESRYNP